MITCYFGVPGCGKTTLMTKFAIQEINKIKRGKSKYKAVYTNFYCEGAYQIDFKCLDKFKIKNSLLIFDEITLDADNRKYKEFSDNTRDFFILHRHLGNDVIYATQSFEMVDIKIRHLTQQLWYISRSVVPILTLFTTAKRIYRNININEYTSELVLGYRFCNFLERFFVRNNQFCFRKRYYKYFDSYDEGNLAKRDELPETKWGEKPLAEVIKLLPKDTIAKVDKIDLSDLAI